MEWQPMATAPRDGKMAMLLWMESKDDYPSTAFGYYSSGLWHRHPQPNTLASKRAPRPVAWQPMPAIPDYQTLEQLWYDAKQEYGE